MKQEYTFSLSLMQVEILLDTVTSFVDNQKLLHIPCREGESVALPLTEKALRFVMAVLREKGTDEPQQVTVRMETMNDEVTKVQLSVACRLLEYEVRLDEFDPV